MRHRATLTLAVLVAVITVLAVRAVGLTTEPAPQTPLIAVCNVDELIYDLMHSDRYEPDLEKHSKAMREEIDTLYNETMKKYDEANKGDGNGPDSKKAEEEYDRVYEKYTQRNKELRHEYEQYWLHKMSDAYLEVRKASQNVAAERGFAYVLSSDTTDTGLHTKTLSGQYYDRQLRRVLVFPENSAITRAVRDVLRVPHTPMKDEGGESKEDSK